jgi:osmotically-inducible protein OsmY
LAACLLAAGGCSTAGTISGVVATSGIAVAQERSVADAINDVSTEVAISSTYLTERSRLFLNVDMSVVEGRVLLTGIVKDTAARRDAARIAWQAPGVTEVINEIEVAKKSAFWVFPKDLVKTARLRMKLMRDREIKDINYDLEIVDGTLYLIGIARDRPELQRVIDHARQVGGIQHIVNHVRLQDTVRNARGPALPTI